MTIVLLVIMCDSFSVARAGFCMKQESTAVFAKLVTYFQRNKEAKYSCVFNNTAKIRINGMVTT